MKNHLSFYKRWLGNIRPVAFAATVGTLLMAGCNNDSSKPNADAGKDSAGGANAGASTAASGPPAVFSLAWSEYPSWSVFGVAEINGIIDGAEGAQGDVEKKWNVDIVLKQRDYDPCLQEYGASTVDGVCMTNMDSLAPSISRPSVAILPTSTSVGADACIVVGINTLDELKGKETFGLERSVSQYCFERVLEMSNQKPADFTFKNMDPGAAAQAMQVKDEKISSIMVWNPFLLQTLRTREGSKVLFDSSAIPEEIIDMVVVSKDSLAKKGGKNFAYAIIDAYYQVNKLMADPKTSDKTLVDIGSKFSNLGLEDMKIVVEQTKFYKNADEALALLKSDKFQKETMPKVVEFCVSHGIVDKAPAVAFGQADAQFNIDPSFLEAFQAGTAKPE
jgi:NitT/TauT family transport system substrate-binding protein